MAKKAELVSKSKKYIRVLKNVLGRILKLVGSGPSTDIAELADIDVDVKPLGNINDTNIEFEVFDNIIIKLEETKFIIDDNKKEEEITRLMTLLLNNNNKSLDTLLQAKQKILNIIETETKTETETENVKKLETDLIELIDLSKEYDLLQNKIKNNIK